MTCSLINIFTVILYFTAIFEYHGHMRLRSSPTHQPTDQQLKCLYIYSTIYKHISMGQGVDSVSYPGPYPLIHPFMSLKMYILLYTYVTYYGMNWINIFVFVYHIIFIFMWYSFSRDIDFHVIIIQTSTALICLIFDIKIYL